MAKHNTFGELRPAPTEGEYLTIQQVADWLQISRGTAWSIVMVKGEIPYVRLTNRVVRISRADVEEYLRRCRSDS